MTRYQNLSAIQKQTSDLSLGGLLQKFDGYVSAPDLASIINSFEHWDKDLTFQSDECVKIIYSFLFPSSLIRPNVYKMKRGKFTFEYDKTN